MKIRLGHPETIWAMVILSWVASLPCTMSAVTLDTSTPEMWGGHAPFRDCLACHAERPDETAGETHPLVETVPALCMRCHGVLSASAGWAHGPFINGQCLFCHTAHASVHPSLLALPTPALCTRCHEPEALRMVPHHTEAGYQSCLDCHHGHTSPRRALLREDFMDTAAGLDYLNTNPEVRPRPVWMNGAASLQGLRGVVVLPVIKEPHLLQDVGITDTLLQNRVVRQLKEHGIPVAPPGEGPAERPELQITLRLMPLPSQRLSRVMDTLVGSIRVSLRQPVRLLPRTVQAEPALCLASTWETGGIVRWTTAQAGVGLEEALKVLVGEFCRAYREVNEPVRAENIPTQMQ
jgi:predicted CXXCH cytochrome family protein